MAKKESGGKPAILALVDAAWGSSGGSASEEYRIAGSQQVAGKQQTRSGGGSTRGPGYGGRKGVRKVAPAPPPRRKP